MIVVAFHIVHALLGFVCKLAGSLTVYHSPCNPSLYRLLETRSATDKARFLIPENVALHRIPETIVEVSNPRQRICIALIGQPLHSKLGLHDPSLADSHD
ncbi:hypothetical protein D3C75_605670 [compost metagenome]